MSTIVDFTLRVMNLAGCLTDQPQLRDSSLRFFCSITYLEFLKSAECEDQKNLAADY